MKFIIIPFLIFIVPKFCFSNESTYLNKISTSFLKKNYITDRESRFHDQNYSEITLGWDYSNDKSKIGKIFSGQVLFSNSIDNEVYWHIQQANLYKRISKDQSVFFGKKLIDWSKIDKVWSLGLWEPSYKVDGFNFSREGLTGLFYEIEKDVFNFLIFYSQIYVPDQGPSVKVKDGKLVSANRWFNNNLEHVQIGEFNSPLNYILHTPEVKEVVAQESYAFKLGVGSIKNGPRLNLAYSEKPINQLYVGIRPLHSVSLLNVNRSTVLHIYPEVVRHSLATLEFILKWNRLQFWTSFNSDRPHKHNINQNWVTLPFVDEDIYSTGVIADLGNANIMASHIYRKSGIAKLNSTFESEDLSHLSDRYLFEEATLLGGSQLWNLKKYGKMALDMNWIHSLAYEADMLSSRVSHQYFIDWKWFLGFDVIGVKDENLNNFFSKNRSQDRVYGGLKYDF